MITSWRDKDEQLFQRAGGASCERAAEGGAGALSAPNVLRLYGQAATSRCTTAFSERFYELTEAGGQETVSGALPDEQPSGEHAEGRGGRWRNICIKTSIRPEQVQDFYPTPGTVSTCMFYTGLDPYTLKPVYVAKTPEEKAMQRALLQYYEPKNTPRVRKALQLAHREDLIPLLCGGRGAGKSAGTRPCSAARPQPAGGVQRHGGSTNGARTAGRPDKGAGTWRQAGERKNSGRKNLKKR